MLDRTLTTPNGKIGEVKGNIKHQYLESGMANLKLSAMLVVVV